MATRHRKWRSHSQEGKEIMEVDLTKLSIGELEQLAYRELKQQQRIIANINIIEQQIAVKTNEANNEPPKKETK